MCSLSPYSIPLLPPLQIPCSLVAKLISNSCAPTFPDQTQRNAKETPSPESAAMLGLCYWVGVNENTVEPMPNFFLGVDLFFFFFFFFFFWSFFSSSNFKPPPTHKGSAVFLNIGLTNT